MCTHPLDMPTHAALSDLTGHLLIAMPGMGDPRFSGAVVYMCAHSDDGAMGLIVNKPLPDLSFPKMLSQIGIEGGSPPEDLPVCYGGPVEPGRGFVLHTTDRDAAHRRVTRDGTMEIGGGFWMTATIDVLEDLAMGGGPDQSILALGYAGWGPGQLEGEIGMNGWLTCEASEKLVFDTAMKHKWEAAMAVLGIDPLMLSHEAGRA